MTAALLIGGCETAGPSAEAMSGVGEVRLSALTEIIATSQPGQPAEIKTYVEFADGAGQPLQMPCTFRFELYEYIQRSAEPKGKRAKIWDDVDLTDPVSNIDSWRDFLRAYEFSFPCEQTNSHDYILQVTCLCPNGKRLSSEFTLRNTN